MMHSQWGWTYGWGMMATGWLLFLVLMGLAVWAIARSTSGASRRSGPLDLLDERYARGELTPEEYRERRNVLEATRR